MLHIVVESSLKGVEHQTTGAAQEKRKSSRKMYKPFLKEFPEYGKNLLGERK
jgi:hypothetical protein